MSPCFGLRAGRGAWVQVARGAITVNVIGQPLEAGDGMAVEDPGELRLEGQSRAGVLLFDMALSYQKPAHCCRWRAGFRRGRFGALGSC